MRSTYGPAYVEKVDGPRLHRQLDAVRTYMLEAFPYWKTLREIAEAVGAPEASVSAQLRHLRKWKFGSYEVEKRRRTSALWEYRVHSPAKSIPETLF